MMTIKELIETPSEYPEDTKVVVRGHPDGGGYDDCSEATIITITKNPPDSRRWRGEFSEADSKDSESDTTTAVVIC